MKNYEQASEELSQFEEALKKAEIVGMKVEWFSAFKDVVISHSRWFGVNEPEEKNILRDSIKLANKKLGM